MRKGRVLIQSRFQSEIDSKSKVVNRFALGQMLSMTPDGAVCVADAREEDKKKRRRSRDKWRRLSAGYWTLWDAPWGATLTESHTVLI